MDSQRIGLLAALVGLPASLGFLLSTDFREWAWPVPVVVALALGLLGALAYIAWSRRQPAEADQRRADAIFRKVPRAYMKVLDRHDFWIAWPQGLIWPVRELHRDLNGPEHRFESRALEKSRKILMEKADTFDSAHFTHSFPTDSLVEHCFFIGWSEGYLEHAPEEHRRIADERQRALLDGAREFEEAHQQFVEAAHRHRFNLAALENDAPPWAWNSKLLPGQEEEPKPEPPEAPPRRRGITDDLLDKEF